MGFDDLHKKRQGKLKARKENIKKAEPLRYLIVCEGEKTEPGYFEVLKRKLNEKYRPELIKLKVNCVDVHGTGKNTESLIEYTLKIKNNASIGYGNIWCVFDKDSFTKEQFNNAILKAEKEGIKTAWSNEAIELWFVLYFEYLTARIDRKQYIRKLNFYFKKYNINKGKYEKNLSNIYEILEEKGNYESAVVCAKRLEKNYSDYQTPADRKPMTTVYKLVEELKEMLKN